MRWSSGAHHARVLLCAVLLIGQSMGAMVEQLTVVEIGSSDVSTKIAVLACSGLYNRDVAVAGAAYTLAGPRDAQWLQVAENITAPTTTPAHEFVSACLSSTLSKGYILYNVTGQKALLPLIITLAGVLDAVPLEYSAAVSMVSRSNAQLVFNATAVFAGMDMLAATEFVFEHYGNQTTTMSKMNPGLDESHPFNPPLTGTIDVGLTDFIVKQRLFNFFLAKGCEPTSKEHTLMEHMVASSPFWPKPISVYGYDDTFAFIGDLFEAETTCVPAHSMGQIASSGVNNLAFFSRHGDDTVTKPLVQNDRPSLVYNSSRTYISFIIGDGDNVAFVKGSRFDWFNDRLHRCAAEPSSCFPLAWSISPHLTHLAPSWLRWYYNNSLATKQDYFVMPPSGHMYAYPSLMKGQVRQSFVNATMHDAWLLNTTTTVAWEFATTWPHALEHYFPLYSSTPVTVSDSSMHASSNDSDNDVSDVTTLGTVNGFFAVNVPFNFPVMAFGPHEYYKVIRGKRSDNGDSDGQPIVVFKPREWRGTTKENIPFSKHESLTVNAMAAELNGYAPGTVTNIYLTSDGGANLDDLYALVSKLDEYVTIVDPTTLVDMALQQHASLA